MAWLMISMVSTCMVAPSSGAAMSMSSCLLPVLWAHAVVAMSIMAATSDSGNNRVRFIISLYFLRGRFFLKKSVINLPHSSASTPPVTTVLGWKGAAHIVW